MPDKHNRFAFDIDVENIAKDFLNGSTVTCRTNLTWRKLENTNNTIKRQHKSCSDMYSNKQL